MASPSPGSSGALRAASSGGLGGGSPSVSRGLRSGSSPGGLCSRSPSPFASRIGSSRDLGRASSSGMMELLLHRRRGFGRGLQGALVLRRGRLLQGALKVQGERELLGTLVHRRGGGLLRGTLKVQGERQLQGEKGIPRVSAADTARRLREAGLGP